VLPERRTPIVAILFTTALAVVLIAIGELETLADTTVLLLLLVFAVVNVSVLVLRRDAVGHDHFRTPSALPVVGIAVIVLLLTQTEAEIFGWAGALLALGVVLYGLTRLIGREDPALETGEFKL
jgi:amino acid transporter